MDKSLMTVRDAARRLALKEATVRAWMAARRIGYIRVGRRAVRIPLSEVERLLNEGTVPAREQRNGRH